MGSKHESIMQYIDKEIMKFERKGKICIYGGSLIFAAHFAWKLLMRRTHR